MTRASFSVICPDERDFDLARQFIGAYETGLRGGDALHLAVARNHGAEAIYTLDRTLLRAADMLGVPGRTIK